MIEKLLESIPKTNPFGEKVTLVAAVKLQTPEDINRAIKAGITDIGDNHVQEFKDKFDLIEGNPRRHFIGHLQTNKIKYLVGKVDLYHSVDRIPLAEALSARSERAGVTSDILLQINIGDEETKGGFSYGDAGDAYRRIKALPALRIKGLMAMLPLSSDEEMLSALARKMRGLYDRLKDENFEYLSMGMSGDYEDAVRAGATMVRVGTAIFGSRLYT